jgi:hypothetical protein
MRINLGTLRGTSRLAKATASTAQANQNHLDGSCILSFKTVDIRDAAWTSVVDTMNREVIPLINALEKKDLPRALPVQPLDGLDPQGKGELKDVKVASVDPQQQQVFVYIPNTRRVYRLAVPIRIDPGTTKIIDANGNAITMADIKPEMSAAVLELSSGLIVI